MAINTRQAGWWYFVARIGVTGHMKLTRPTVPLVREVIRKALAPYVPAGLTGVSCIAAGADSIFAEVVLDLGGALGVILPASDYRERKVQPAHLVEIIWPEGAERS
jgi:hypothetical protein